MSNLLPAKGCIFMTSAAGRKDVGRAGFYRLGNLDGRAGGAYILIESIHEEDQDLVSPLVALDKKKFLYVFGSDFKTVTVQGSMLMGPAHQPTASLAMLRRWFAFHRVSRLRSGVTYSAFQVSGRLYPVKLIEGPLDPTFNTQPFQIIGFATS